MNSFSNFALLLLIIFTSGIYCKKSKIPDFLKVCKRDDPKLDTCIAESLNDLKPHLARGIPQMKLFPFDPLRLAEAQFLTPQLNAYFADMEFHAAHDFALKDIHMDLEENSLSLNISYKELVQTGKYKLTGRLLAIQLNGNGHLAINFTRIEIYMKLDGKRITKGGKEYIQFEKIDYHIKLGDFHSHLDNLFVNNPELTDTVNRVFNENSQSLISDYEEICRSILGKFMLASIQRVFSVFSIDDLIPK